MSQNPSKTGLVASLIPWLCALAIIVCLCGSCRAADAVPGTVTPELTGQLWELALAVIGAWRILAKLFVTYRNGYVVATPEVVEHNQTQLVRRTGWFVWVTWFLDTLISIKPGGVSVAADRVTIQALHPDLPPPANTLGPRILTSLALLLSVSFLGAGCLGYRHTRYSETGKPLEETRLNSPFLTKTTIEGLKTNTRQTTSTNGASTYSRQVGVSSADNAVDTAGVQALESLIGRAIMTGLGVPPIGAGGPLVPPPKAP